MTSFQLAQLNIAEMLFPLESPEMADFVSNLDRINALADTAPGFVWRLQTDDGDATSVRHFGEHFLVNMSVWENSDALHDYVYGSAHREVMGRRREWFARIRHSYSVLWWVPREHRPSIEEAEQRLLLLRAQGPSETAFTFEKIFAPPSGASG